MALNGRETVDEGWITGYDPENGVQQHGVDLRVTRIGILTHDSYGVIFKEGKAALPFYTELDPKRDLYCDDDGCNSYSEPYWFLTPGYYQVAFEEGMCVPKDKMALVVQRSSAIRSGIILSSSVFDAGFRTESISTFFAVFHPVKLFKGARLAQALFYDCTDVENPYNGSYAGVGRTFHDTVNTDQVKTNPSTVVNPLDCRWVNPEGI
jgi:dUTP pyrophosphatase